MDVRLILNKIKTLLPLIKYQTKSRRPHAKLLADQQITATDVRIVHPSNDGK